MRRSRPWDFLSLWLLGHFQILCLHSFDLIYIVCTISQQDITLIIALLYDMPYRTLLILGHLGILSPICFIYLPQLRQCMQTPLHQQSLILLTRDWLTLVRWLSYFVPSVARDVMTGPVIVIVFVCLVLFYFLLLETITRFLSIVCVILLLHDVLIGYPIGCLFLYGHMLAFCDMFCICDLRHPFTCTLWY